jgi:hypothetical protein
MGRCVADQCGRRRIPYAQGESWTGSLYVWEFTDCALIVLWRRIVASARYVFVQLPSQSASTDPFESRLRGTSNGKGTDRVRY